MHFRTRLWCLVVVGSFLALAAGAAVRQDRQELPKDEEGLWRYALDRYNQGQWQEGDRGFRQYIQSFPKGQNIELAYYYLGYLHLYYSHRFEESRKAFEQLAEKFPKGQYYWHARFAIGQTYQSQGLTPKAIEVYEKIFQDCDDVNYRTSAIHQIWNLKGKQFYPYVSGTFTTGQKAVVHVNLRNVDKVEYRIVRVKYDRVLEHLKGGDRNNLGDAIAKVGKEGREELKKWIEHHNIPAQKEETKTIEMPSTDSGIYILEGTHDRITMTVTVFVTKYGIITKSAAGKLLVFAQDRATSKPVAKMQIKVLHKEKPLAGETDEEGLFVSTAFAGGTVVGIKEGELVTTDPWYYDRGQGQSLVYVTTDRPIYRPNQAVHFKVVHRNETGSKMSFQPGAPVWIEIRDTKRNSVYKAKHSLNEFGTAWGKFTLGDEPALGHYTVLVRFDDQKRAEDDYEWGIYGTNHGTFRVDEYRKPEYKVDVTYSKPSVIQGETVEATVQANYYFGSPVAHAQVQWKLSRRAYWYWWGCWDWYYDWYADDDDWQANWRHRQYDEPVTTGTGTTDAQGKLTVRFTPDKRDYDCVYTLVAQVTDLSRRTVDGGSTVKATRAEFGLAASLGRWVYKPGEKVNVRVRATTPDEKPVRNQKIQVRAFNVEYHNNKNVENKLYQGDTVTDEHGVADVNFTPEVTGGYIRVEAETADRFGNRVTTQAWVWVCGESWWGDWNNFNGFDLIPDKKTYEPGETAKILITSQHKNVTVLLTLEGKEVYEHRVVQVKGHAKLVEVKLDHPDLAPNFFVSVSAIKENQMVQKYKSLIVNPAKRFVNVKITPDKREYRPREKALYRIETTGADGKPVSCEVSLGIVDESIYALQEEFAADIRKFLVHKRSYEVATSSSLYYWDWGRGGEAKNEESRSTPSSTGARNGPRLDSLAKESDAAKGQGGGGGKEYAATEIRSNFADTMHWVADLVTDANGRAEIAVPVPDNLTTWKATARAVTKDNRFGQEASSVVARKDVIVRLELPRFFTQGDETLISVVAHNYLKSEKEMKIVLEIEGLQVQGDREHLVKVAPEGQKRFDWKTKVDGAGLVKVTVKALTDESSDAMELVVPILPHGSVKWESKAGFVENKVVEKIRLPKEAIAQSSELIVVVSPTHASTVLDALDYLAGYPYGCVEQTMSRFLPTVVVGQTLQKLGIEKPGLKEELPKMVAAGLQRLYNFQQQDGGWGWWQNDKSNAWTTAYVLFGLALARQADYVVDENVFQRGIAAARGHLASTQDDDVRAYLLWALQSAGQKDEMKLEPKTAYGRALAALVSHHAGKKEEAQRHLGYLTESVKETGSTAYWEGRAGGGWLDHSVETTAVAMKAFLAADPKAPIVAKIVNWLASVRTGNYWASTKQTAMVVFAMTDYLAITGDLNPDMTVSLSLNGDRVFSERVTKENWQKFNGTRTFKAKQFNEGENEIAIEKTGTGTPVYSIFLRYYAKEDWFSASKGGIVVERSYSRIKYEGGKRVAEALKSGDTVKSGEEIEVTARVRGDRNYEWLMLEVPMPSGFEAVREYYGHYGWYWNYWYSHKEFRDERVAVAMTQLWTNHDNVVTYTMRAETPGTYSILPAVVYNMYHPQIGGNSEEFRLSVVD